MIKNINENTTIKYEMEPYENKKDCLWYGGLVARVEHKDAIFDIAAIGDVRGHIYKDGEFLTSFKDKGNCGNFAHVMRDYLPEIDTDEKLRNILDSDISEDDINKGKLTVVKLENNNWWEVIIYKDRDCVDSYVVDSTDDFDEALKMLLDEIEDLYQNYCVD